MLLRQRINDALRANLIAFARGSDLDHLASFYDAVRLVGESDDAFRRRTILIIASRSTGGTAPRYRAVALGASIRVKDAIAYREGILPTVNVAVISTDSNGVADEPLLETVRTALNNAAVRMVNDTIAVRSAITVTVPITADIWLYPDTAADIGPRLVQKLREAWASEGGLGFDLTRSWLTARLMQPGVQRVSIIGPAADVQIPPFEAIALGNIDLTIRGRDF
nr:baseplate J/gp47 family protein [Aestuariivirga sp. YIM B02566]